MADDGLLASEKLFYTQQAGDAQFKKRIADAQNQYQRSLTNQTYGQQLANLTHQYGLARAQVPQQFIKRGVGNGGLYQQGLANFAYQGAQARQQLALQNELQNRGFDLTATQSNDILQRALQNLQQQQDALRADRASQIADSQSWTF